MLLRALLGTLWLLLVATVSYGQEIQNEEVRLQLAKDKAELARYLSEASANTEEVLLAQALQKTGVDSTTAREWSGYFVRYGHEVNAEPRLLAAIAMHESQWNRRAFNPAGGGSHGLMQVVPGSWLSRYSSNCGVRATSQTLRQPRVSICYGAYIYAAFLKMAGGDLSKALRGYNSGMRFLRNGYDNKVMVAYKRLGGAE